MHANIKIGIMIAVMTSSTTLAMADKYEPSVFCAKPIDLRHLATSKDDYEYQQMMFEIEADRYKQCISDFIAGQQDAITAHQEAIQSAYDEWNIFIKTSKLR